MHPLMLLGKRSKPLTRTRTYSIAGEQIKRAEISHKGFFHSKRIDLSPELLPYSSNSDNICGFNSCFFFSSSPSLVFFLVLVYSLKFSALFHSSTYTRSNLAEVPFQSLPCFQPVPKKRHLKALKVPARNARYSIQ